MERSRFTLGGWGQRCLGIVLAAILGGCSTPERAWMSGTRLSWSELQALDIGLLPAAINPSIEAKQLPVHDIEDAVLAALEGPPGSLTIRRVPGPASVVNSTFPLTPEKLASENSVRKTQALVGLSLAGWTQASEHGASPRDARVDLLLSLADASTPPRQWTIASTWAGKDVTELVERIKLGLPPMLTELQGWLGPVRIRPVSAERNELGRPAILFHSPELELDKSQTLTSLRYLPLNLTAIDDSGLEDITVSNPDSKFSWRVSSSDLGDSRRPIYLASKVSVPLRNGSNKIMVEARPSDAKRVVARTSISIVSQAPDGLLVASMAAADYEFLPKVAGSTRGAHAFSEAARGTVADTLGPLIDETLTSKQAFDAADYTLRHVAAGNEAIIYFSGRAFARNNMVFMPLTSFDPQHGSGDLLRIADLPADGMRDKRLLILDLCTEPNEIEDVRQALGKLFSRNDKTVVSVTPCDSGRIGALGSAAANVLATRWAVLGAPSVANFYSALTKRLQLISSASLPLPGSVLVDAVLGLTETQTYAPPIAKSPSLLRYYVVTNAFGDLRSAVAQGLEMTEKGTSVKILRGASGFFGIAIDDSAEPVAAYAKLAEARKRGIADPESFVVPSDRVQDVLSVGCGQQIVSSSSPRFGELCR